MNIQTLLPLFNSAGITLFGVILTFFVTRYWIGKKAVKDAKDVADAEKKVLNDRITELERSYALVNQSITPISAAFQAILIKELTHFHTPVMDKLLEKLGPPNLLTIKEEESLILALKRRTKDMADEITDSEREAAVMLPMVMKRVKIDSETPEATASLQMVGVPDFTKDTEEEEDKNKVSKASDIPQIVGVPDPTLVEKPFVKKDKGIK